MLDPDLPMKHQLLLQNIFQGSKILKRDVDKSMLYFNLPDYIIKNMLVPTKLFPRSNDSTFPQISKIIDYFNTKKKHIPNIIVLEAVVKKSSEKGYTKYIIAAFSKKSWNKDLLLNRE